MIRFLLVLMLLVTAVKHFGDRDAFVYDNSTTLAEQDDDNKKEKGEQGKGKYNEDKVYSHSAPSISPFASGKNSFEIILKQYLYPSFITSPSTPPPNAV